MISADPTTLLGYWCRKIAAMKPGERLTVDVRELIDIPCYEHNGAHFTPPDRILDNIVGSAYTHSFDLHPYNRTVTFIRHEETGERYYEDPDRREGVSHTLNAVKQPYPGSSKIPH